MVGIGMQWYVTCGHRWQQLLCHRAPADGGASSRHGGHSGSRGVVRSCTGHCLGFRAEENRRNMLHGTLLGMHVALGNSGLRGGLLPRPTTLLSGLREILLVWVMQRTEEHLRGPCIALHLDVLLGRCRTFACSSPSSEICWHAPKYRSWDIA